MGSKNWKEVGEHCLSTQTVQNFQKTDIPSKLNLQDKTDL